jgi:hypothetical protein
LKQRTKLGKGLLPLVSLCKLCHGQVQRVDHAYPAQWAENPKHLRSCSV